MNSGGAWAVNENMDESSPSFGESRRRRRIRLSGALEKKADPAFQPKDKHCDIHPPTSDSWQSPEIPKTPVDTNEHAANDKVVSGLPRRNRKVAVEIDMRSLEETEASSMLSDIDLGTTNILQSIVLDFGYFFKCLSDSLRNDSEEALSSACVACVNPTLTFESGDGESSAEKVL